jgi:hypothetical protein
MDRCANCGYSGDLHVHHRRLRSQGGPSTYSNQVTLCQKCHGYFHAHPAEASAAGMILFRGNDPERAPIAHFCWPGTLIYLKDDGSIAFWVNDSPDGEDWHPIPTRDRK